MRLLMLGWVLALPACGGCVAPPAPVLTQPYEARPLDPPAWYKNLHEQVLDCLRQHGARIANPRFGGIRWYVARPGVMGDYGEVPPWSGDIAGKWSWPDVVILDARYVGHPGVIKHELAHYALQAGAVAHPIIEVCEK